MPRLYAQNRISMWQDDDFRALSADAQNLYNYLLAHPSMTYAGVADWFPKRLAHVNASWTEADVQDIGIELTYGHFVVIDEDWDEVCVRSFFRHEQVLQVPPLARAAAHAFDKIESPVLQRVVIHELGRLQDEFPDWAAWDLDDYQDILTRRAPLDGKRINLPLNSAFDPPTNPPPKGGHNPAANPPSHPAPNPPGNPRGVTSNKQPVTSNSQPVTVNLEPSTTAQARDDDEITARSHLRGLDLDYVEVRKAIVRYCKRQPTPGQVVRASLHFLAKIDTSPDKPLAYVVSCMKSDWAIVQQQIDEDVAA